METHWWKEMLMNHLVLIYYQRQVWLFSINIFSVTTSILNHFKLLICTLMTRFNSPHPLGVSVCV